MKKAQELAKIIYNLNYNDLVEMIDENDLEEMLCEYFYEELKELEE